MTRWLAVVLLTWTGIPAAAELEAELLGRFSAPEARQGVAVDEGSVYAVGNRVIARYEKQTGARRDAWRGPDDGPVIHLNSCYVEGQLLLCAHSNYPGVPMASSVERFTLDGPRPAGSTSLAGGYGSLTWYDRRPDGWWAAFAHYDGRGGEPGRDHRWTRLVRMDDQWQALESFELPGSVLESMAPYSTSGGSFGPDGLLYVTGHDRGEIYVLERPDMRSTFEHLATVAIDIEGQAIAWDRTRPRERILYGISRSAAEIRWFRVPEVALER